MFLLKLLPLLCLVAGDNWPDLKTTFGLNPFGNAFYSRPRTVSEAEAAGWQLLDSCNGQWLGHRWVDPTDVSLVLLFDDAGYIAGTQSGMLAANVDESVNPVAANAYYQPGDFFGEAAWFTTVYFVDPAVICNGGRSADEFNAEGTGDRVLVQVGPTPDNFVDVPLTQAEGDSDPFWYDHYCFLGMGDHYLGFNYQPDQDCTAVIPFQILYDQGVITGFVWQHIGNFPGDKWEHPDAQAVSMIIDRQPTCIGELLEYPGLSTMHHYFYSYPWLTTCPFRRPSYRQFMMEKSN